MTAAALRISLLAGLIAAAGALDAALVSRLLPYGPPDLALVVVVSLAMRHGLLPGAVAGAVAGYLRDLVTGGPLGVFVTAYLLAGVLIGLFAPLANQRHPYLVAGAAIPATLLHHFSAWAVVTATGLAPVAGLAALGEAAVAAPLNAVLARPADAAVGAIDALIFRRHPARIIGRGVIR